MNRRDFLKKAPVAAVAITVPATAFAPAPAHENPKLIALAGKLPAIATSYHKAFQTYEEMKLHWKAATPLAPDEITEIGESCSATHLGEPEVYATNEYLYRSGEKFPRRIVRDFWRLNSEIRDIRRLKRQAMKNGDTAEYLHTEEKIKELKIQRVKVQAYEVAHRDARNAAKADHNRLYPIREQSLRALADHVSAIMAEPDWTMEGLTIKAEALMEWNRLDKMEKIHGHLLGADWHASIAASILRHAKGVTA